jgi:hypothetical protein
MIIVIRNLMIRFEQYTINEIKMLEFVTSEIAYKNKTVFSKYE